MPANKSRTTIGITEVVLLSTDGKTWSVSGAGTLDSTTKSDPQLTAGSTAGQVTVTVTGGAGGCTAMSLSFTVIAPSGTSFSRTGGIKHTQGQDNIGMKSDVGVLPDTVSFKGLYWIERDAPSTASGTYACLSGGGHNPNPAPLEVGDPVPGRGGDVGIDTAYFSGCPDVNQLGDGSVAINIPDAYSIGSAGTQNVYTTVTQRASSSTSGALSIAKGGSTGATTVNSPSSNY